MTALYAPTKYNAQFVTIAQLGDSYRLTVWQFGRATGHAEYGSEGEAVKVVSEFGFTAAGEGMRAAFEEDVLISQ